MGSSYTPQRGCYCGGCAGKIDTPLNEKLANVEWGEYRIGNLFEINSTKSFNSDLLVKGSEYDYITRTSLNQGILCQTGFVNEENINPAGVWSLGLLQMDFFYRNKPWYAGQFVRKVIPKIELSKRCVQYFTVLFNKLKPILLNVLVRDVDKTFLNIQIKLPTRNGEIDFAFMEEFVAELEAQRVAELEAYLTATGLTDYHLTPDEKASIADFNNIQWGGDKICELFEKIKVKKPKYKTRDLPNEPTGIYTLPALTAGIQNQGLNNFVPRDDEIILKNVISISANGANTGVVFYQSKEFAVLQDAYAIQWIKNTRNISDLQYVFFVVVLLKTIYGNYEWTNKAGWNKVKEKKISLPMRNDEIDFDYMDVFIRAVEKLVIHSMVDYTERKISAARQACNRSKSDK